MLASPVYKGSYAGLFKHLFDLLEPRSLVGKPVLLGAVGGGPRHALVIEHQLRPLLGFFEAQTLATGVYAAESDFEDGILTAPAAIERLDRAIGQFAPLLLHPNAPGERDSPEGRLRFMRSAADGSRPDPPPRPRYRSDRRGAGEPQPADVRERVAVDQHFERRRRGR